MDAAKVTEEMVAWLREKVAAAARALGYHKTPVERRSDAGDEPQ